MPSATVRHAVDADIDALVTLINRAFAVELLFKTGDRTDAAQTRELLRGVRRDYH